MIQAEAFAERAYFYRDSLIPYSKLDCQAFVERVLADCGLVCNWRGSNHMWREALSWKGTIKEAESKYGAIPRGAWLFTLKKDGGEKERGYEDGEGNAAHVGIYTGRGLGAMHSTTGGVQETRFPATRWTHVGLCRFIIYPENAGDTKTRILGLLDELGKEIAKL